MSSRRKTTQVEDRAYSLMGLLDANMLMLCGEGKKAFHRLQPEYGRTSSAGTLFTSLIMTLEENSHVWKFGLYIIGVECC